MDIRFEHKEAMKLIGFSARIRPEQTYEKCPQFWESEYTRRFEHLFETGVPENGEELAVIENKIGGFALCSMNDDDTLEYVIAGKYEGGRVPWGMKVYDLPESDYAVFTNKGPWTNSLKEIDRELWTMWYPLEGFKYGANTRLTVEVYPDGDRTTEDYEMSLWIPVKRTEE